MQSKTSLFNKTLFKKNMTRLAPVWAAYLGFLFLMVPMNLLFELGNNARYSADGAEKLGDYLQNTTLLVVSNATLAPYVCIFALIACWACFSYLYFTRSAYMVHAFPVTRQELFFTTVVSALAMLILPQLVVFVIAVGVVAALGNGVLGALLVWLLYNVLYSIIFVSFATLSCMLTGNRIFMPFIYAFFMVGVDMVRMACMLFFGTFSYGVSVDSINESVFSPAIMITANSGFNTSATTDFGFYHASVPGYGTYTNYGFGLVLGYLVAAIVIFALSWLVYKHKQLETVSELFAVKWLRPVFRWIFGFSASVGIGFILFQSFFYSTYGRKAFVIACIFGLLSGLVCFFIAEMLLKKSPKVFGKKMAVEAVIFAAVCMVTYILGYVDPLQTVNRIPEADEVESVYVSNYNWMESSDADAIAATIALNQEILAQKNYVMEALSADSSYDSINISYRLKNGNRISRYYMLPSSEKDYNDPNSLVNLVNEFECQPKFVLNYIFENDGKPVNLVGGTFEKLRSTDGTYGTNWEDIELTNAQYTRLYNAILQDIEAGKLPQSGYHTEFYCMEISFNYNKNADKSDIYYCMIRVPTTATNTVNALKELHLITDAELITETDYYDMDYVYE